MNEFYDVVDSEGNVVETAEQQKTDAQITEEGKEKIVKAAEKELTEYDKRKLRKVYVTIKHPRVIGCQHRLDLSFQPRQRNCHNCWFAWFNNHGELVQQLDEMYQTHGYGLIVQLQGNKFYHRWRQFMATVAQMKQQENNG